MLMLRMLAAFALLALIVASWLIFGQSSDEGESPKGESAEVGGVQNTAPGAAAGLSGDTAGTSLPAPLRMTSPDSDKTASSGSSSALAELFEKEKVDPRVAEERTTMVRAVTDALLKGGEFSAQVKELECRSHHCRIKIAGEDQKSVSALLSAMQDERGFYGKAKNFMMSRDGDEIHVYLQFADQQADNSEPTE